MRLFGQDFRAGDVVIVVVERQLAAEQGVEDNSKTPNVDLLASILFALEHLGG